MLFWILAGLAVYLVNIYLPTVLFLPKEGMETHAAGRDNMPEPDVRTARARRALANMQENLPIFLTLAILALVLEGVNPGLAVTGAAIWVLARLVYIPAYLVSIPYTRSLVYVVALVGNVLQVIALL